jgi:hypothetical protein
MKLTPERVGSAKNLAAERAYKEAAMKTLTAMRTSQVEKFALFLEEHPGFSPELVGDDAFVHGFRVGECFLSVDEMERLIDTPVDPQVAAILELGRQQ